jgi:hypothetical protein
MTSVNPDDTNPPLTFIITPLDFLACFHGTVQAPSTHAFVHACVHLRFVQAQASFRQLMQVMHLIFCAHSLAQMHSCTALAPQRLVDAQPAARKAVLRFL